MSAENKSTAAFPAYCSVTAVAAPSVVVAQHSHDGVGM
jgi:hypothetical protein